MALTLTNQREALIIGVLISCAVASSYPALHSEYVQQRQSYGPSSQGVPNENYYFGEPSSYNSYNFRQEPQVARKSFQGYQEAHQQSYQDNRHPQKSYDFQYQHQQPSQPQYYDYERDRNYLQQGMYSSSGNPDFSEGNGNMRSGQLRQIEYQRRIGHEERNVYDPFYFNPNPIDGHGLNGNGNYSASAQAAPLSREHNLAIVRGSPRYRRNSRSALPRNTYFNSEIRGDKYEILTSQPNYHHPSAYYPPSRYSTGATVEYNHPSARNPNQFLNYEQIVGAPVFHYPSISSSGYPPLVGGHPWSVQIGTALNVIDDGKGSNSGRRYYVSDERNSRAQQPHYKR